MEIYKKIKIDNKIYYLKTSKIPLFNRVFGSVIFDDLLYEGIAIDDYSDRMKFSLLLQVIIIIPLSRFLVNIKFSLPINVIVILTVAVIIFITQYSKYTNRKNQAIIEKNIKNKKARFVSINIVDKNKIHSKKYSTLIVQVIFFIILFSDILISYFTNSFFVSFLFICIIVYYIVNYRQLSPDTRNIKIIVKNDRLAYQKDLD